MCSRYYGARGSVEELLSFRVAKWYTKPIVTLQEWFVLTAGATYGILYNCTQAVCSGKNFFTSGCTGLGGYLLTELDYVSPVRALISLCFDLRLNTIYLAAD